MLQCFLRIRYPFVFRSLFYNPKFLSNSSHLVWPYCLHQRRQTDFGLCPVQPIEGSLLNSASAVCSQMLLPHPVLHTLLCFWAMLLGNTTPSVLTMHFFRPDSVELLSSVHSKLQSLPHKDVIAIQRIVSLLVSFIHIHLKQARK
jgi:hypothetical protein